MYDVIITLNHNIYINIGTDPVHLRYIKERMNYDDSLRRRNGTYH